MLSPEKHLQHYWDRVQKKAPNECWPWTGAKTWKGYGAFRWNGKNQNAHRVAWILANGTIPDGLGVLHHCDNPECQNPNHLFLGDNNANIEDKMKKGRHRGPRGEASGSAKLTSEQVLRIRSMAEKKELSQSEMAKQFGVHKKHIQAIIYRKTWKHI